MSSHSIYSCNYNQMYKLYLAKVEKKGRTASELDEVISWLTGYSVEGLSNIEDSIDMTRFFENAPDLNENRKLIKGSICGVKLAEIEEPLMREIRYLDKVVDELAKGKAVEKILRN